MRNFMLVQFPFLPHHIPIKCKDECIYRSISNEREVKAFIEAIQSIISYYDIIHCC